MYYLLMLLACSSLAAKSPNPAVPPAMQACDSVSGAGFQSLIFKSENGSGFRTIAT
jgi:hypothetical protein